MKLRAWMLMSAVLFGACDSPTVPERLLTEVYDYRLLFDPQPLVLRWPVGSTVRVYAEPHPDAAHNNALQAALENGIAVWNAAALYNEFKLEQTRDLTQADAVLIYSTLLQPVDVGNCSPGGGLAYTTFCLEFTDPLRLSVFPIRNGGGGKVKFLVTVRTQATLDPESVKRLVAHELGHVLGIAQHSKRPTDLLYPGPITRSEPSPADRATLQVLYHTRADINP
jgi:hypothetical protein